MALKCPGGVPRVISLPLMSRMFACSAGAWASSLERLGLELMVGSQAQQENKGMLERSAHDGCGFWDRIATGRANMDLFRYRHKQFPDYGRIAPQISGKAWFASSTWLTDFPIVKKLKQ